MKISNWITENKILIFVPLLALFVAVVFVFAYNINGDVNNTGQTEVASYPTPTIKAADEPVASNQSAEGPVEEASAVAQITPDTAKVVFQVDGMSCSGCIATIKSSLAGYKGIRDIVVNISGGTADVYYDSGKIKDLEPLASSITASGYPARISQVMTAEQLKDEDALSASRAKFYIASVGGWDISRTDFDTELAYAANRYKGAYGQNVFSGSRGKNVLDSIKVDPKLLDREFDNYLAQKNIDPAGLKDALEKSGYPFDYFMRKFENRVLLRHYIENQVLSNAASDYDKQQQYLAWFNNARTLSKVTIYDKQLERLTRNQSAGGGCGSSCKS
jgi:copper chaperone CopZ